MATKVLGPTGRELSRKLNVRPAATTARLCEEKDTWLTIKRWNKTSAKVLI